MKKVRRSNMLLIIDSKEDFINYMEAYKFNKFSNEGLSSIYEYLNKKDVFHDLKVNPTIINETFMELRNLLDGSVIIYNSEDKD
jgi:hypothetical protein